ncbi:MAG: uroporphyrinogen-III synthase [Micropepsaceae bacterium]
MSQAHNPFRTVLVTRPAHQAASLMTALALRGYTAVAAPVLEMHPTDVAIPKGDFDALAFTSANGAAAFAARDPRRDIPVFAVGPATAAAARKAHFEWIMAGDQGAEALAGIIAGRLAAGSRVLHPAGRDVAVDLGAALAQSGIAVDRVTLYAMDKAAALSDDALRAIERGCIALLYSRRSAEALVQLADESGVSLARTIGVLPLQTDFRSDRFRSVMSIGTTTTGHDDLIGILDSLEAVTRQL